MSPRRVLFVCVANAFRSQIAEGFARHWAQPGRVEVRSGGVAPAGYVHPGAIRLMDERGIDIRGQASKPIDVEFARRADAVVTLCGPLDSACPRDVAAKTMDWTVPDPTAGPVRQQREARDGIEARVRRLYMEWGVLRPGGG